MGNENGRILSPEEMQNREIGVMNSEIKKKLNNKLVKYSLRLVIKGERNTGKTSLFNRLQGLPYSPVYSPTPEIQISHINWNYKNTDDIVDVEVWDVVDVASSQKKDTKLKLNNSGATAAKKNPNDHQLQDDMIMDDGGLDAFLGDVESFDPVKMKSSAGGGSFKFGELDAKTLNVYKNTHGVIFMIDPSKRWTLGYVEKELQQVPKDLYVLLISNFRDKNPIGVGDDPKSLVTLGDIQAVCDTRDRMSHVEASMLNAYGLRTIVSFFNIPFLEMQKKSLLMQIERNEIELETSLQEIQFLVKEQNYDQFIRKSQIQYSPPLQSTPSTTPPIQQQRMPSMSSQQPMVQQSNGVSSPPLPQPQQQQQQTQPQQSTTPKQYSPPMQPQASGGFFSRLLGKSNTPPPQPQQQQQQQAKQPATVGQQPQQQQLPPTVRPQMPKVLKNVEDFVADNDDDDFYNEKPTFTPKSIIKNIIQPKQTAQQDDKFGSDSDDDNPLVNKDYADSDDDYGFSRPAVVKKPSTKSKSTTPSKSTNSNTTKSNTPSKQTTTTTSPSTPPTTITTKSATPSKQTTTSPSTPNKQEVSAASPSKQSTSPTPIPTLQIKTTTKSTNSPTASSPQNKSPQIKAATSTKATPIQKVEDSDQDDDFEQQFNTNVKVSNNQTKPSSINNNSNDEEDDTFNPFSKQNQNQDNDPFNPFENNQVSFEDDDEDDYTPAPPPKSTTAKPVVSNTKATTTPKKEKVIKKEESDDDDDYEQQFNTPTTVTKSTTTTTTLDDISFNPFEGEEINYDDIVNDISSVPVTTKKPTTSSAQFDYDDDDDEPNPLVQKDMDYDDD
ncbi:hypothetical protein CYY_006912 [Polysphondylium violaceum]|uniref:Rab GTPase domain-containing protein n=1 Tax=Polysphondylium violaceum TaxID=133409 RepID=A0A8J4PRJ6_9MYCE|nr:hypothetical protein CYY_006912 [Polysphondylium violaceum]